MSEDNAKFVFEGGSPIYIPVFKEYLKTFWGIIKEQTNVQSEYSQFRDTSLYERYMLNASQFSAAKSVAVNGMMKTQMFNSDGVRKGFSVFKNDCKAITDVTNDTWLRTEYDTSVRQAVSGQQFISYREDADLYPMWMYLETTSEHPREEHLDLVGNIYKIGDPESDLVFPPNGFNCLPAGSLVLTKNGWEEIQNLQINQTVIGGSGDECNTTIVHKNLFNGQLYGIVKKNGVVFYTKNHRIMTIKGWVNADCINCGDIVTNLSEKRYCNTMITYINNCYSFGRYVTMPFIIERCTGMIKRFNSNIFNRKKNINPVFTTMKIVNGFKRTKEINNNKLISTWFSLCIHMFFRMFSIQFSSGFGEFSPDFIPTSGGCDFEFFRSHSKRFRGIFCFAKIMMRYFSNVAAHLFGLIVFPFVCIYPLYLYALGKITHWYINKPKYFRQNSIIFYIPFFRKFFNGLALNSIKFIQDNGDAAPLNLFDSNYMFLYSIFIHNEMDIIVDVNIRQHNDYVYNLTVENDNSYITKTGIVHNCSCGSEQIDEDYLKANGKSVRTNEEAKSDLENGVPEQFRFNPADQGICAKEGHSYFQALPNANDADGNTFGITGPAKNADKLAARGFHLILKTVDEWKTEYHYDHNSITFQNEATLTNVKFNNKSILAIEKHSAGFEQLADTVTKPQEIWSTWQNSKEQKQVWRNYIRGNYVVQTEDGLIVNAYLVDNISRFRKGCLIAV